MTNLAPLWAELAHIDAHPEEWKQSLWGVADGETPPTSCGTAFCVAGGIAARNLREGEHLVWTRGEQVQRAMAGRWVLQGIAGDDVPLIVKPTDHLPTLTTVLDRCFELLDLAYDSEQQAFERVTAAGNSRREVQECAEELAEITDVEVEYSPDLP